MRIGTNYMFQSLRFTQSVTQYQLCRHPWHSHIPLHVRHNKVHQITACHVHDKFTIHVKYKTQSMSCNLLEEDNGDTHTSLIIYMWTKILDKEKGVRDCERCMSLLQLLLPHLSPFYRYLIFVVLIPCLAE